MQRLLADAPSVEYDNGNSDDEIALTADNADKVLEMINKMNR